MIRIARAAVAALALLFLLAACGLVQAADAWAPYRAICQINVQDGRSMWQGSGTLVATSGDLGLVLSCRHVNPRVGMNVGLSWIGAENQQTRATVVHVVQGGGFDTDLALLITQRPRGVVPVPVARFNPANGPFLSAGYRGGRFLVSHASRGEYADGGLVKLNSAFIGGMSGGCTFDRYGRQVAVVVASDFRDLGYSSDGNWLHDMLALYRR